MSTYFRYEISRHALRFFAAILVCGALACATPREVFREGAGRPLVMLGGGVFGAAMFAPHARELSRDFEVIRVQTLNVQAAEDGSPMPSRYSVASEAAALRQALDKARVRGPVDIAGVSYGALVALRFALAYPGRVRTLTLFEPPVFWLLPADDPDTREMRALTQRMTPGSAPNDAAFAQFQCLLGNCPAIPSLTDPARRQWDLGRLSMRGLSAVAADREDIAGLRALRVPTLILTGNRTVAFHRRIDARLAEILPNAAVAELNGGHSAPRTDPEDFIRELRAFLARH